MSGDELSGAQRGVREARIRDGEGEGAAGLGAGEWGSKAVHGCWEGDQEYRSAGGKAACAPPSPEQAILPAQSMHWGGGSAVKRQCGVVTC